jgi:predicted DsbA family dithiol-disulfide isomerase
MTGERRGGPARMRGSAPGDRIAVAEKLRMKVTAFVDVLSHWCLAAQPALNALHATLADDVAVEVVIAPLRDGGPVGFTNAAEAWFYTRGTLAYGTKLDPSWCEDETTVTWHANAAVAAAVALGANALELAPRVSRAAMVEGALLGREDEAVRVVSQFAGIDADTLRETMRGDTVVQALHAANARLAAIGCAERPSWELVNDNGDRAVLQGVWQAEAILPLARALLDDERAYRRAGVPPT